MNVVVIEDWYFFLLSRFIQVSSKAEVMLIEVYQTYIPCTNFM
jgi:hypothetical protein